MENSIGTAIRRSMKLLRTAITVLLIASTCKAASAAQVKVVFGAKATQPEKNAARDLSADIARVCGSSPKFVSDTEWMKTKNNKKTISFIVGTPETNAAVKQLVSEGKIEVSATTPGPEAFVIQPMSKSRTVVISGSDVRGVFYGVYEYSNRFLGVDPYEFWMGKEPPRMKEPPIPSAAIRSKPPVFALRGYFDNDDDMIANWKGRKLIIEFDLWKEMIDSLARLRYNYIDIFDTLGRAEFWNWKYYKDKVPDYHADLKLVEQIIDYAHGKGMMVQVPVTFGYEFHRLPIEKICLSRYHDDWLSVFDYYMKKTPIGKADLFEYSPRDPWWDRAYRCPEEEANGIAPGPLHTRMINDIMRLVKSHNPKARVVGMLWSDAQDLWLRGGYEPDKSIDYTWADNGYAMFPEWPDDFKGHEFGIYVHAGFFLNHVMQDPYPERIKNVAVEAQTRGMTRNFFVNGQDFRHFILNLEACGRAAWDPAGFDPDAFYKEWTTRYFGAEASPYVVESLKALYRANAAAGGYAKVTGETVNLLDSLRIMIPLKTNLTNIDAAMRDAEKSLKTAITAMPLVVPEAQLAFDDYIRFPSEIYLENLRLHKFVAETMNAFADSKDMSLSVDARKDARVRIKKCKKEIEPQLELLIGLLNRGSRWDKWAGWTKVENFRKITPPPAPDDVKRIIRPL